MSGRTEGGEPRNLNRHQNFQMHHPAFRRLLLPRIQCENSVPKVIMQTMPIAMRETDMQSAATCATRGAER